MSDHPSTPDQPEHADRPEGEDLGEQTEVRAVLADAAAAPMPPEVLAGLLDVVQAEARRREEGETTRERAAAISSSLERTNQGTFGLNVPRRPTLPQAAGDCTR